MTIHHATTMKDEKKEEQGSAGDPRLPNDPNEDDATTKSIGVDSHDDTTCSSSTNVTESWNHKTLLKKSRSVAQIDEKVETSSNTLSQRMHDHISDRKTERDCDHVANRAEGLGDDRLKEEAAATQPPKIAPAPAAAAVAVVELLARKNHARNDTLDSTTTMSPDVAVDSDNENPQQPPPSSPQHSIATTDSDSQSILCESTVESTHISSTSNESTIESSHLSSSSPSEHLGIGPSPRSMTNHIIPSYSTIPRQQRPHPQDITDTISSDEGTFPEDASSVALPVGLKDDGQARSIQSNGFPLHKISIHTTPQPPSPKQGHNYHEPSFTTTPQNHVERKGSNGDDDKQTPFNYLDVCAAAATTSTQQSFQMMTDLATSTQDLKTAKLPATVTANTPMPFRNQDEAGETDMQVARISTTVETSDVSAHFQQPTSIAITSTKNYNTNNDEKNSSGWFGTNYWWPQFVSFDYSNTNYRNNTDNSCMNSCISFNNNEDQATNFVLLTGMENFLGHNNDNNTPITNGVNESSGISHKNKKMKNNTSDEPTILMGTSDTSLEYCNSNNYACMNDIELTSKSNCQSQNVNIHGKTINLVGKAKLPPHPRQQQRLSKQAAVVSRNSSSSTRGVVIARPRYPSRDSTMTNSSTVSITAIHGGGSGDPSRQYNDQDQDQYYLWLFHDKQEFHELLEELLVYGQRQNWKKKVLSVVMGITSCFVVYDLCFGTFIWHYLEVFFHWMTHHIGLAVFAFVILFAFTTFVFIPPTLLTFGAGFAFCQALNGRFLIGVLAAFTSVYIGSTMGAMLAFFRSRYLSRDLVQLFARRYPIVRAADQALERNGLKIMILLRLCPLIPFNGLNYVLGITSVSWEDFMWALLIGSLPMELLTIVMGASAEALYHSSSDSSSTGEGTNGGQQQQQQQKQQGGYNESHYNDRSPATFEQRIAYIVLLCCGIFFAIVAVVYTWRKAKKELQKELDLESDEFHAILHPNLQTATTPGYFATTAPQTNVEFSASPPPPPLQRRRQPQPRPQDQYQQESHSDDHHHGIEMSVQAFELNKREQDSDHTTIDDEDWYWLWA